MVAPMNTIITIDPLLTKITAYLDRKPLTPDGRPMTKTTFGKAAVNDSAFVFALEGGREVKRATRARVEAYIEAHPPTLKRAPKKKAG
jgi:hypothetical protein